MREGGPPERPRGIGPEPRFGEVARQSLVAKGNRSTDPTLERFGPGFGHARLRPHGPGCLEGKPDDELVDPLRLDDRADRDLVRIERPATADGEQRSRGGAVVIGQREADATLPEVDPEQSCHGPAEPDGAGVTISTGFSTVRFTRLAKLGTEPDQSGETESSTWP